MGFIPIAQLFLCTVQKRKEAGVGKPAAGQTDGDKGVELCKCGTKCWHPSR